MLITLFMVMTLSFMVIRLMPMSIFENPEVSPEIQKKLEDRMHLNDPIPVQYFYFMKNIVTDLDFGTSVKVRPGQDVFSVLVDRLPPTILLNVLSLFICIPLGLIFGTIAALKRNTWIDNLISFLVVICISVLITIWTNINKTIRHISKILCKPQNALPVRNHFL